MWGEEQLVLPEAHPLFRPPHPLFLAPGGGEGCGEQEGGQGQWGEEVERERKGQEGRKAS